MYTKILVPLDGSHLSEAILPYVRFFAKTLGVQVELLHAIDPEIISTFSDRHRGRSAEAIEADVKQHGLDYLDSVAGSLPDPLTVKSIVQIGKPAKVVADRAASYDGTLVVMATHGHSGVDRWFMGSVADKVMRVTTTPLVLVRPIGQADATGVASLKKVLVPLDGSGLAEKVLPHVEALAKRMSLEVVLVRVYLMPEIAYPTGRYAPDWKRLDEEMREETSRYLQGKMRQLQKQGLEKVSSLVLEGDAAGHIIYLARQTPQGLVAICTHGRTGIGRWVLGSVTERVVRHSGGPVLVIPAPTRSV